MLRGADRIGNRGRFVARSIAASGVLVAVLSEGCTSAASVARTPNEAPARPLVLIATQVPVDSLRDRNAVFPATLAMPLGARLVRVTVSEGRARVDVLTRDFASAADPCVSFAGDSLVFAGKRGTGDPWRIWRTSLDRWAPEPVTEDSSDCREPFYLPLSAITPPEFADKVRWIGYTSTAAGTYDEHGRGLATAIHVQSLDTVRARGTRVNWRTTFNIGHDFSPSVLADGRTLFSSWRHETEGDTAGTIGLLAANWDGTNPHPFAGNHGAFLVRSMACENVVDRTVVYVESDGRTPLNGGYLARARMRRPLRSRERISRGPDRFLTPHALPDGGLVVACAKDGRNYGIYRFDPETGLGAKLFDDPKWADIDPQGVIRRPEPQGRITIVLDDRATGDITCLNVYDSDRTRMRGVVRGQVRRVRVVEGVPRRAPGASGPDIRVIGEAPVHEDGSFHVRIPADVPIAFHLLDEDGFALMRMRGWTWVRRGDLRGCVGCHEDRELAPDNRLTEALAQVGPHVIAPPEEERRPITFARDVRPIFERSCAPCHTANHASGLDLATGTTRQIFGRLLAESPTPSIPLVAPGDAMGSRLALGVAGREGRMPPHGRLPAEEIRTIIGWIDLGARLDGIAPAAAPARPGADSVREGAADPIPHEDGMR